MLYPSASQVKLSRKIAQWKAALADLGRRNPLMKFRTDSPRTLEILLPQPGNLFEHVVEARKSVGFSVSEDELAEGFIASDKTSPTTFTDLKTKQSGNEKLKRLKRLRSEARKSLEEIGVNSLFLVFGTLTWFDKDNSDEPLLSPLILVPVEITKRPKQEIYEIAIRDEDIVLNSALALKLQKSFGINLPEEETLQGLGYGALIQQIQATIANQKKWKINEEVYLSLFSYAKAAMVKDLIEHESRIASHPILQAISGDLLAYQANYQEPMPAAELDRQVQPRHMFQVLDADSSQQTVIEAAKSGTSFVVQGPPGTGKSQTIVNMIAELIGSGKSVLLVAEKATALSVVYQRMADCGLAHLCLDLHHSGTTDKRRLIDELSKTTKHIESFLQESEPETLDHFFNQLTTSRQSLSSYLKSLHTKEKPIDKSPFELFGELLKADCDGVIDLDIIFPGFSQWNEIRLEESKILLNQLAPLYGFFFGQTTTIWEKSALTAYSYELELELRGQINEFQQAIIAVQEISQKLTIDLKLKPIANPTAMADCIPMLNMLLAAPDKLPENWLLTDVATAEEARATLKKDIAAIEEHQLSAEASRLIKQLTAFTPFLRQETTTVWAQSKLDECSEQLAVSLKNQIDDFQSSISKIQSTTDRLNQILGIPKGVDLRSIEQHFVALEHILIAPPNVPENWLTSSKASLKSAFSQLSEDVAFLEEHESAIQERYTAKIFSSELSNLNSRFQRYSRFWLIRIFNLNYRRDRAYLKALCNSPTKLSHRTMKADLDQAVQIQTRRNHLYQSSYPAQQMLGSLFRPDFAAVAELDSIQQALDWQETWASYSLLPQLTQEILSSPILRQELRKEFGLLKSAAQALNQLPDFLLRYFSEQNITDLAIAECDVANLMGTEIIALQDLLNWLAEDLPKFSDWLTFRAVSNQLEQLGAQAFISALKENRVDPLLAAQQVLHQADYLPAQVFGSRFKPSFSQQSDLAEIEVCLAWLNAIQPYLKTIVIDAELVQQLLKSPVRRRELGNLAQSLSANQINIETGIAFLLKHFAEEDITDQVLPANQVSFLALASFLNIAESDLAEFQDWLTCREICMRLEAFGLNKFLEVLRDRQIEPVQWFPSLRKLIYKTCLEAILTRKPELKNFNVAVHERTINEFGKLDHRQMTIASDRLKLAHARFWQRRESDFRIQSELANLKREATKKIRHLPIRQLLNDQDKGVPHVTQALKPCWMMSPLSVSRYIDPNIIHFDVLIFDEASQLRTEDVVPSIIRADQVIVIGDTKQLPPTNFFSSGEKDEEEQNDEVYESVLNECSTFMFERTLKWHYRSQDERLIAFSNRHFYNSELVTFPNPIQNPNLGVWFEYVPDGIYDRGGRRDNRREAEVVAKLALKHFQETPDLSLGIIAFSEAQAEAIQEQIEILGQENPELEIFCQDGSSQYFLKALENVQGDERDVILLSVGYARDAQGKLTNNFGPLIKKGGERRLNVAVTRAKSKITLVSSIRGGDINLSSTASEGVRTLRDYLEYAASGGERLQGNSYTDRLHFDSPFEEDVYRTLANHPSIQNKYTIRTQVGCSGYRIDLAACHNDRPGEFLLGIECDGASYHSSPTARDRDRLRQQILEKLGWKIHRIWSTDWFRNKREQTDQLVEKLLSLTD
jgi:very-short-patch-repair endonuclease